MNLLRSGLLIAVFTFSVVSADACTIVRSKSNQSNNFTVQCTSCTPVTTTTQSATAGKTDKITINLPGAGTYKISVADGPNKGKLVETITVTKTGSHEISLNSIRNVK